MCGIKKGGIQFLPIFIFEGEIVIDVTYNSGNSFGFVSRQKIFSTFLFFFMH